MTENERAAVQVRLTGPRPEAGRGRRRAAPADGIRVRTATDPARVGRRI